LLVVFLPFVEISTAENRLELHTKPIEFSGFVVTEPYSKTPVNYVSLSIDSCSDGILVEFEIKNYQPNESAQITARDADILDDYVEIIFDFSGDANSAYGFRVSANGSINDFSIDRDSRENRDWDGIWQPKISFDDGEWIVQLLIPWSTTLYQVKENNEQKIESKVTELKFYAAVWNQKSRTKIALPAISQIRTKFMTNFQTVTLEYQSASEFFIEPYLTYDYELMSNTTEQRTGLTLVWKDPSKAISYAYLPDFGQVESNELVLNLSAIETFFSEKRRFFLDEAELYDIRGPENLRIFHSTRIGSFSGPNDEVLNIKHALKYSQLFENLELGYIYSKEEGGATNSGRQFEVVRGRFSKNEQNIGLLLTQTQNVFANRKSDVYTADFNLELEGAFRMFGFFSASKIIIAEERDKKGNAGFLGISWDWNDNWSNELSIIDYGEDYDLSDAGFVARNDRLQFEFETSFEITKYSLSQFFESSEHVVGIEVVRNQTGLSLGEKIAFENEWVLVDKQKIILEIELVSDFLDDNFTRGNNLVALPASSFFELEYENTPNSEWLFSLDAKSGSEGIDGSFHGLGGSLSYSLFKNTSLTIGLDRIEFDSYLIWDEGNDLVEYQASETEFEISINTRIGNSQSVDLKLESVALKANALRVLNATQNGELFDSGAQAEDLSIGELAMSIRYRYQPNQHLNWYLVYSRGGENELSAVSQTSHRLIRQAYLNADVSRLFTKIEYRF